MFNLFSAIFFQSIIHTSARDVKYWADFWQFTMIFNLFILFYSFINSTESFSEMFQIRYSKRSKNLMSPHIINKLQKLKKNKFTHIFCKMHKFF